MTVEEVCAELRIARATWDKWRQRGCGPRAKRLPNRQLRIHRDDLAEFMAAQPE
ncbi:MAG: helix-turn-helix domain-containing protein [Actinomycetota bacterium]|nr:helix-turn-helix domain-containing protein [Actinomycetota bacterium]